MTSAGASGESPDLAVLGDGMSYPELPVKLPAWGQRSIGVKGGGEVVCSGFGFLLHTAKTRTKPMTP